MATPLLEPHQVPPAWSEAFERVPRVAFIPDQVWDGQRRPVDRATNPARWAELANADAPVITQLDDGTGSGDGYVSSSASKPSIVVMMLDALNAEEGHRVLEVGTGTGWNASLLCARLGEENVTTIEVDPDLAETARERIAAAGFHPQVVAGDGMAGWPEGAPYDRVISTAAVQQVPHTWVAQAQPGGRIVTPWGTAFHNGTLLRLDVGPDGSAQGRFGGDAGFMWVRAQRTPHGAVEDRVLPGHDFVESVTDLHPYEPVADFDASFAVGLRVPRMLSTVVHDGEVSDGRFTVYLMDPESGSWASWRITPETVREYRVRQHGPRSLFDELAAAYAWWLKAGRPEHDRFGLTVTAEGQQVWLDNPDRPLTHAAPG
ncbi:protein-L-isoaspartate O-methyltransferase [Nocardiopsis mwathae]|uniref:Protein-L-isoaspartate O-methyltransferase n=1 Tax=Nocardiopsis mwathae TaxID=1472723 RepID=A0A7X0D5H6_9ACTN|nr:protein-L-isoaspartate O-methyltransferase [Nocardiopsis mwathae]